MPDDPLDDLFDAPATTVRAPKPTGSHLPDLIDFAKENKLTVGSTTGGRHNVGSKHYTGNAVDIKGSGAFSNDQVSTLKAAAAARGLLVRDERSRPRGQKVWGGPHIHVEYAGDSQDPLADLMDKPAQPKTAGAVDDLFDAPTSQPTSARGMAMANAQAPTRSLRGTTVRPLNPKGWGTGKIGDGLNEPVRPTGTDTIFSRATVVNPTQARQVFNRDAISPISRSIRANTVAQGEDEQRASTTAGALKNIASLTGSPTQLLPDDAQNWINEAVAKGGAQLMSTAAGLVRHGIPALEVAKMFGAPDILQKPVADKLMTASSEVSQRTQSMDRTAKRGTISQGAQDVVGGGIGSAPAMALISLGVPAPVAFGMQSSAEAQGRDAELSEVVKETTKGAAIGALFEMPLPSKVALASQITQRLAKAGIVGAGTKAVDLASGANPSDYSSPIVNALFAASDRPGGGNEGIDIRGQRQQPISGTSDQQLPSANTDRSASVLPSTERVEAQSRATGAARQTQEARSVSLPPIDNQSRRSVSVSETPKPSGIRGRNEAQRIQPASGQDSGITSPQLQDESALSTEALPVVEPTAKQLRVSSTVNGVEVAESIRHVDVQPRRQRGEGKGQFKKETRAQAEERRNKVEQASQPARPGVIDLNAPIPNDALRAINKTFNQTVGPDIYGELPENPTAQDVIQLLAEMGLSDQVMGESVPKLRALGYSRIGDVLITDEGLKFAPKELQAPASQPASEADPLAQSATQQPPEISSQGAEKSASPLVSEPKPEVKNESIAKPSSVDRGVEPLPPRGVLDSAVSDSQASRKIVTEKPEPLTTSARKSQMAGDRAELDLPELPPAERKSWQTSLDNAKPEKASVLADEVLTKPRALNDEETASLVVRAQQIKNEHSQVMKELGDATDPEQIATKRAQSEALEREFDRLTTATKASGTEKGRALASQKFTINQDFDLVSVLQRMKAAKGRELTSDERTKYESMVKERDQAIVDRDAALERAHTAELQKQINKSTRQRARSETKEALDSEAATIKTNIAAEFARLKSAQSSVHSAFGLGSLDPEGVITKELLKYARNRVKANVGLKAEELIDEVHDLVKDFGASRRQVAEVLSGYMKPRDTREVDRATKELADIRKEIKGLLTKQDVAAGVRTERAQGPRLSEATEPKPGPTIRQGQREISRRRSEIAQGLRDQQAQAQAELSVVKAGTSEGDAELARSAREQAKEFRKQQSAEREAQEHAYREAQTHEQREAATQQRTPEGPSRRFVTRNEQRLKQLQAKEADLTQRMAAGDYTPRVKSEPLPYTREVYAAQKRAENIERQFQNEAYKATRGTRGRIYDEVSKFGNLPKTLKSMADISAVFRQGGFYAITHPVEGLVKPSRDMFKAFSEMGYRNVENAIKNHPKFDLAKRAGIEFTGVDKNDPNLSHKEEGYLGTDALGTISKGKYNPLRIVKGTADFSERTFVSFLDSQRIHVFDQMTKGLESQGITYRKNPEAYKAAAKLVNQGTGRGDLGRRGNQAAPLLNLAMFSPRLVASRVQLLNNMFNPAKWAAMPKGTREIMIKDNVKFLAGTAAVMALATAAGGTVNRDPDDGDFLKIRFGSTTYDTLTGLQQPLRAIWNMSSAVKADLTHDEAYAGRGKAEIASRFARSKLAPLAGVGVDYLTGKDFEGRQFSASREARDMVTPLPASDFVDAMKKEGLVKGLLKASPTVTGVGVQTYDQSPEKATTQAEKLSRKFVRDSMSDVARTDEELDKSKKLADLRARSRKGEDVSAELGKLNATDRQANAILDAHGKSRLQEDFNRLGAKEALIVYSTATPDERKTVLPLLQLKTSSEKLAEMDSSKQADIRSRMRKLGIQELSKTQLPPKPLERVKKIRQIYVPIPRTVVAP